MVIEEDLKVGMWGRRTHRPETGELSENLILPLPLPRMPVASFISPPRQEIRIFSGVNPRDYHLGFFTMSWFEVLSCQSEALGPKSGLCAKRF